MNKFFIRATTPQDLPVIKTIIDDNQMFPSDMLDEMIAPFLRQPEYKEFWLTCETDHPIAVAYCAPEAMTEGTWNLLLLAVDVSHQGQGTGQAMMTYIEQKLVEKGQRILLVETSGVAEFELTRRFYLQCGYTKIASIPEYYSAGDDKVVFWKKLTGED